LLLEAEERRRVAVLNRLRGRPAEEAIDTSRSLADLPDPVLPDSTAVLADAEVRSPELQKSQLAIDQAAKQVDLAEKGSLPDLTVSAGVMPRGGDFETMWTAGVSFSIPIWSRSKQSAAVEANTIQGTAARYGAESTRQLLHQRMIERQTVLSALIETNRLYRAGLLVQSEATVASTTAQYQVGRITFASVLEALTGYVADTAAFYESVAATQRVEIAQRELSLEPVAGVASAGMGGAPMPGAGAMSQGSWSDAAATASPPAARSGSMSGM